MGVHTPEQMNVSTPYWTTFPALAISGVDWDDHDQAHRAVMRMFPRDLGGRADQRRAANGILFRHDLLNGVPNILVQSYIPPELMPAQARSMTVPKNVWGLKGGTSVEFRVAVNPVRRFRGVTRVVSDDELPSWLQERISHALDSITILNVVSRITRSTRGQRMMTVKTVDAVALVVDEEKFATVRRHGVGRSKSYGAGLLTARAIG